MSVEEYNTALRERHIPPEQENAAGQCSGVGSPVLEEAVERGEAKRGDEPFVPCSNESTLEWEYEQAIQKLMKRVESAGAEFPQAQTTGSGQAKEKAAKPVPAAVPEGTPPQGNRSQKQPTPSLSNCRSARQEPKTRETRDQLMEFREVANDAARKSVNDFLQRKSRSALFTLLLAFCILGGVLTQIPLIVQLSPVAGYFVAAILIVDGYIVFKCLREIQSLRKGKIPKDKAKRQT